MSRTDAADPLRHPHSSPGSPLHAHDINTFGLQVDFRCEGDPRAYTPLITLARARPPNPCRLFSGDLSAVRMSSSPLSNGKQMSDNQSWNSSGSEEDLETDPGPHGGGVAEFSGVLSKVNSKGGGFRKGENNLEIKQQTGGARVRVCVCLQPGWSRVSNLILVN